MLITCIINIASLVFFMGKTLWKDAHSIHLINAYKVSGIIRGVSGLFDVNPTRVLRQIVLFCSSMNSNEVSGPGRFPPLLFISEIHWEWERRSLEKVSRPWAGHLPPSWGNKLDYWLTNSQWDNDLKCKPKPGKVCGTSSQTDHGHGLEFSL